jgi:Mg2+-importing ATPase
VSAGIFLPYSPFSRLLGFVPLPAPFFVFLAISTVTYLVLVELGKRMLRLA